MAMNSTMSNVVAGRCRGMRLNRVSVMLELWQQWTGPVVAALLHGRKKVQKDTGPVSGDIFRRRHDSGGKWQMRIMILALVAFGMTACSFAPDYQRIEMPMPESWSGVEQREELERMWWKRFDDAVLNSLVEEAFLHNRDMVVAAARVDQARARLGTARAEMLPLLSGQADASPVWVDNHQVQGSTAPYSAGFGASWEIDLWGKLRNASASARYQLLATEEAREGVRLSVAAQTANGYFMLRSLDVQMDIAERTLQTREEALKIYTARYEQGLISQLDFARAGTEVESARTALAQTRVSRDAAESALLVLTGRSPREIMDGSITGGAELAAIPTPPVLPAGVPSDLLERRPDIRQAEYTVQSANADIGVARAAWFPSISLTGLLGVVSPELHLLMSNPLETWSYGGTASVPLLDFGRVAAGVDAAEAKKREALATYEKTVQAAFGDMRDALMKQQESVVIVTSLETMVEQLRLAADLARARYDSGYCSYLDVLDAERSLFESELNLASARGNRLVAIVNVCLALGGGWKDAPSSVQGVDRVVPEAGEKVGRKSGESLVGKESIR